MCACVAFEKEFHRFVCFFFQQENDDDLLHVYDREHYFIIFQTVSPPHSWYGAEEKRPDARIMLKHVLIRCEKRRQKASPVQ